MQFLIILAILILLFGIESVIKAFFVATSLIILTPIIGFVGIIIIAAILFNN